MRHHRFRLYCSVAAVVAALALVGCEIAEYPYYVRAPALAEPDPPPAEPPLMEIDYLVVRYSWTEQNGRDLDTRTAIVRPARNADVGWGRLSADDPVGTPYLVWGDDNVDIGCEAVLVDLNALRTDYPAESELHLGLRAFWYAEVGDGGFTLELTGYRGGTMAKDGYNWVNQGGEVERSVTVSRTVMLQTMTVVDGVDVGVARYVVESKTLEIVAP